MVFIIATFLRSVLMLVKVKSLSHVQLFATVAH